MFKFYFTTEITEVWTTTPSFIVCFIFPFSVTHFLNNHRYFIWKSNIIINDNIYCVKVPSSHGNTEKPSASNKFWEKPYVAGGSKNLKSGALVDHDYYYSSDIEFPISSNSESDVDYTVVVDHGYSCSSQTNAVEIPNNICIQQQSPTSQNKIYLFILRN